MATASDLYLSPDQRNLLLAALNSNTSINKTKTPSKARGHQRTISTDSFTDMPSNQFTSPDMFNGDGLGDFDYDLNLANGDFNYDFGEDDGDHDKRKHSSDDEDDDSNDPHEGGPKRREGDDKTAKKPGRKPLTNEPTSKRKAQNRAAQRAFRERKEKHLKDLELKVIELEKKSDTTDQENKSLRDQVETLQSEVKNYRKRMSVGEPLSHSPTSASKLSSDNKRLSGGSGAGGFSFDFPMFGQVGNNFMSNGMFNDMDTKDSFNPSPMRSNSVKSISISPQNQPIRSNSNSSFTNSTSPRQAMRAYHNNTNGFAAPKLNDLSNLFSPSILEAASKDGDYMSKGSSSMQSTPQLIGGMLDFSDSPSASSVSQSSSRGGNHNGGFESSCDTSPEPMLSNSPMVYKPDMSFGLLNPIKEEGENTKELLNTTITEPDFSWLADQNGNTFDPVLFNDYRDPIDQINSGIGMSFFDDALGNIDFTMPGSPAPLQTTEAPRRALVPELNDDNDDDDEVMPAEDPKSLLSCGKIWDIIAKDPRMNGGDLDVDNLCSELRSKAKCSETGVVVAQKDVESVISKLQTKRDTL